jgi:hypothetical protein
LAPQPKRRWGTGTSRSAPLQALSERYGINQKTVAKWRRRRISQDPRRTVFFNATGSAACRVSRPPPPRQQFRAYPLGYVHIDLAEVWTEEGKLYLFVAIDRLFVAIDRVSKFAFAELHERARRFAADFLR